MDDFKEAARRTRRDAHLRAAEIHDRAADRHLAASEVFSDLGHADRAEDERLRVDSQRRLARNDREIADRLDTET